MPVLRRKDGAQFVFRAYRESLDGQSRHQLRHNIIELSKQQGNYTRIYRHKSNHYEAVFTNEAGYLLAETIYHHYDKSTNLIFCELVNNGSYVLVVVIKDGSVFLDNKIALVDLQKELLPLYTAHAAFRIIISNQKSLLTPNQTALRFPQSVTKEVEVVESSVIDILPLMEYTRLQPLSIALKTDILKKPLPVFYFIITGCLLIFACSWWLIKLPKDTVIKPKPITTHAEKPFQQFYSALETPSPVKEIDAAIELINAAVLIPGWQLINIKWNSQDHYALWFSAKGGEVTTLANWAKEKKYIFSLEQKSVLITAEPTLKSRRQPKHIYPFTETLNLLLDEMNTPSSQQQASIVSEHAQQNTQQAIITIKLTQVTALGLADLAEKLRYFPINLVALDLGVHDDLISGNIEVELWGK